MSLLGSFNFKRNTNWAKQLEEVMPPEESCSIIVASGDATSYLEVNRSSISGLLQAYRNVCLAMVLMAFLCVAAVSVVYKVSDLRLQAVARELTNASTRLADMHQELDNVAFSVPETLRSALTGSDDPIAALRATGRLLQTYDQALGMYVESTRWALSDRIEQADHLFSQLGIRDLGEVTQELSQGIGGTSSKKDRLALSLLDKYLDDAILTMILKSEQQALATLELPVNTPMTASDMRVSSHFGFRVDPISGRKSTHRGIDVTTRSDHAVRATGPGKVVFAGRHGGFGNKIVIQHAGNIQTVYAHLSRIDVEKDEFVLGGAEIGIVGSTGRSTGRHLHYEVIVNGLNIDPRRMFQLAKYQR